MKTEEKSKAEDHGDRKRSIHWGVGKNTISYAMIETQMLSMNAPNAPR